jgi:hypothetical protein
LIKFLTDFKTFVDHDSFIADCVHPLANKLNNNEIDSAAKLSLGLYQLTQALQFLHEKVEQKKTFIFCYCYCILNRQLLVIIIFVYYRFMYR